MLGLFFGRNTARAKIRILVLEFTFGRKHKGNRSLAIGILRVEDNGEMQCHILLTSRIWRIRNARGIIAQPRKRLDLTLGHYELPLSKYEGYLVRRAILPHYGNHGAFRSGERCGRPPFPVILIRDQSSGEGDAHQDKRDELHILSNVVMSEPVAWHRPCSAGTVPSNRLRSIYWLGSFFIFLYSGSLAGVPSRVMIFRVKIR
jgi:hypothetical protein